MEKSKDAAAAADSMRASLNGEVQQVSIKTLIEAGAHFGHQTTKWNPKMLPYIYGQRNGIHIINLDITLKAWQAARKFIYDIVAAGGSVLFVGTKNQARSIVEEQAKRSKSFYVTNRWLGGTLSNFETIKRSIERMRKLEELLSKAEEAETDVQLKKKERLMIRRELEKLSDNLGGIRSMRRVPDVLFIVDVAKESIAVAEARRLHIPVVSLVDSNCDPDKVDFPIPSNDDASRTIRLFVAAVADAVIEAQTAYNARMAALGPKENKEGGEEKVSRVANAADLDLEKPLHEKRAGSRNKDMSVGAN